MHRESDTSRPSLRGLLMAVAVFACLLAAAPALGAGLQDKIDSNQSKIDGANQKGDVLSTDIEQIGTRIDGLEAAVSRLRGREAAVEARLSQKQDQLDAAVAEVKAAHEKLVGLRSHLNGSIKDLSQMLRSIYRSGNPDFLTVLLSSDDYSDFVGRSEYVKRIQDQNEAVVERVRTLRNEARGTVRRLNDAKEAIQSARDAIASRKAQLDRTRGAIEGRKSDLVSARADRKAALAKIDSHVGKLEDVQHKLQQKLQEQIATATGVSAGPIGNPSAAGLIWPVDGIITSGYGYRWGELHEGIDIAVPVGTPIRAATSGTVIIAGWTGGYGNYTCIDHGDGLSTCYGHQSGYAVSVGDTVRQGDIIGYSGDTGHSTGPHVHFEVRINGASTDPLPYL